MRRRRMSPAMKRRLQSNLQQDWRRKRFKQQGGLCFYCGAQMFMEPERYQMHRACTLEHRTPLSRGGADHWENSAAACERCNKAKGNMTEAEFRANMALCPSTPSKSSSTTPASEPTEA